MSMRYTANAGICNKCGNAKTWETKIKNPKTGKMIPAHIDANGQLLGNGECPYYANQQPKQYVPPRQQPAQTVPDWGSPAPAQQRAPAAASDATKSMQNTIQETLVSGIRTLISRIDEQIIAKLQEISESVAATNLLVGAEVAPENDEDEDDLVDEGPVNFS